MSHYRQPLPTKGFYFAQAYTSTYMHVVITHLYLLELGYTRHIDQAIHGFKALGNI